MICTQGRLDQVQIAPDDRVVVDAGNLVEVFRDSLVEFEFAFGRVLAMLQCRIEAADEQRMEIAGDRRIAIERGRDEFLALRYSGLLQIAAIGAQYTDLARAQTGSLGQGIVGIIVMFLAPHGQEHFLEQCAAIVEIDGPVEGVLELHVVDVDASFAGPHIFERPLADDPETHILEQGNTLRQFDRRAVMEDLQPRMVGLLGELAIEVDGDRRLGGDGAHIFRIYESCIGCEAVAIAFRKTGCDAGDRVVDTRIRGGLAQPVIPGAGERPDMIFQDAGIDLGCLAAGTADDEMHPRQAAFREGRVVSREPSVEGLDEELADLDADAGIVTIPRHEHQHRDEAVELVDAVKNAHSRPLAEREDRFGVLAQYRHADLEQFVARIGFQHVDQRLARMIAGIEARLRDHRFGLGPKVRDLHHRTGVGRRREQAHDPEFAGQLAFLVEGLDADIIEVDPPVDDRFRVRLGDDQRVGTVQESPDLGRGRDRLGAATQDQNVRILQDAQAGLVCPLQRAALLAARIFVLAHPQEGEIVVAQPLQESDRLDDFRLVERQRLIAEIGDRLVDPGKHRLPVDDGGPNLRDDVVQPFRKRRAGARRLPCNVHVNQADAVDAVARPGAGAVAHDLADAASAVLDQQHRVENQRWFACAVGDLADDGIEQERHVVVDDGDHRQRPAAIVDGIGIVDADHALARAMTRERRGRKLGRGIEGHGFVGRDVLLRCT